MGIPLKTFSIRSLIVVDCRSAAKEEAEEGKKKKGGISVPEEWPWEEAKKIFEKPDVTPADEVDVRRPDRHVRYATRLTIVFNRLTGKVRM